MQTRGARNQTSKVSLRNILNPKLMHVSESECYVKGLRDRKTDLCVFVLVAE